MGRDGGDGRSFEEEGTMTQFEQYQRDVKNQTQPVVRVPGPFEPYFGPTEAQHEVGWRIVDARDDMVIVRDACPRLIFGNERDCLRGCDSFNEALANGEDAGLASDHRVGVLATKYLAW